MNQLFIDLYLADLIRARGFEAITTTEAGQLGKSDAEQLAYAISKGKVLLTHNRVDFERLAQNYFDHNQTHCGIIFAFRNPPQEIARRLLIILNYVTADEMYNQVRYI